MVVAVVVVMVIEFFKMENCLINILSTELKNIINLI